MEDKSFWKSKTFWLFVAMEAFAFWDKDHAMGIAGIAVIILRAVTKVGLTWKI